MPWHAVPFHWWIRGFQTHASNISQGKEMTSWKDYCCSQTINKLIEMPVYMFEQGPLHDSLAGRKLKVNFTNALEKEKRRQLPLWRLEVAVAQFPGAIFFLFILQPGWWSGTSSLRTEHPDTLSHKRKMEIMWEFLTLKYTLNFWTRKLTWNIYHSRIHINVQGYW